MARLAAIWNVWDGDELLFHSIKQIREHVDEVIVVYQNQSNYGEIYHPEIPSHLCDYIIHYKPQLHFSGTLNETAKRNIGLDKAKELGCTHFILMDNDELYDTNEFKYYKDLIYYNNCESSACRLYTYYKYPTIQITPLEDYYVPFICKLNPTTRLGYYGSYPVITDPTRQSNHHKDFYKINIPLMHHYSWVRKDIERKIRNSSARMAFKNKDQIIKEFNDFEKTGELAFYQGHSWIEVQDKFGIGKI